MGFVRDTHFSVTAKIATAFPTLESLNGVLSVRQALRLIASDKADDAIEIQPMLASEPEPELASDVRRELYRSDRGATT